MQAVAVITGARAVADTPAPSACCTLERLVRGMCAVTFGRSINQQCPDKTQALRMRLKSSGD
jgi:hypothetical protein